MLIVHYTHIIANCLRLTSFGQTKVDDCCGKLSFCILNHVLMTYISFYNYVTIYD